MQDTLFWRWLFSAVRLTITALCVAVAVAVIRWLIIAHGPGFDLKPLTTPDLISIVTASIALAAFLVAFWFNRGTRQDAARVEKSTAYLNLEIASSEVFKYEAEKDAQLRPYRTVDVEPAERARLAEMPDAKVAYNLYFQTLNLFEICARFRRQGIIEHQVFASWVAWFYDTLDDWYFREMWSDFRTNYTEDVRDIFDLGTAIFAGHLGSAPANDADEEDRDRLRREAFYDAVAGHMQCTEIGKWLSKTREKATEAPALRGPVMRALFSFGIAPPPPPTRLRISSPEPSAATLDISAMVKSRAG
ncbi:hypothetical protein ACFO8O_05205 [Hephaestia sp. GCM10023244]|uniref:hypothetical protein n=1 Tax=unclassified Hephaestia TaxID=2631281 RepID=UPI0020772793|nr:hypothetical protein [Hephaestia sp. MAHUQ-44]MCM8730364.1 hypothetical protein [Hephaestia sp. MAHUQ-44]